MKESLLPELLEELRAVTAQSSLIATVSTGRPNWIASIVAEGVWLETEASRSKGVGPQLVPAWMLNAAWHHLRSTGTLDNRFLLSTEGLNVKRSSAVCALLSQLPWVEVASSRPIMLRVKSQH
ncbi:MAG TPA: hypothetical protein VIR30_06515 [Nocardioides sp.]